MRVPIGLQNQVFHFGREASFRSRTSHELAFPYELGVRGVHEIVAGSYQDHAALPGFAFSALETGLKGAVVWVSTRAAEKDHGRLSASGLGRLRPDLSLLSVTVRKPNEALWAVEETLRSGAARLVIAEVPGADFTATRRLALASSRHGVPLVLLLPHTCEGSTAAQARWRVSKQPSAANPYDPRAPGQTRWLARLERCRHAPEAIGTEFNLEFDDETLSLSLVSGLVTRQAAPRSPPRPQQGPQQGHSQDWRQTG